MHSDIDLIKSKLTILDVVSRYVKLTQTGGSFKGLSPFTKEKTPSFFVSPDKGLYHCFSTGKGGDMITFIQEIEGVDFRGALELLSGWAGVTLTGSVNHKDRDRNNLIRQALLQACELFENHLQKDSIVKEYIIKRGINEKMIESFRLGYALNSFQDITTKLNHIDNSILFDAGLVRKKDSGRVYDYFRDRIMFPIFDAQGRLSGFSGRAFGHETTPKYLNSTDSSLYNKSKILYGLDKAKQSIRSLDFVIIVEGQVDLVLSHQIGFSNTVAVSGTGLTEEHLLSIGYLTKNIIFAFDGDKAGINSAVRAGTKAIPLGFNVKMLNIPSGKDPADIISEDSERWKKIISEAQPLAVQLTRVSEQMISRRERFLKVIHNTVIPLVALEKSSLIQHNLIETISRDADLDSSSLKKDVNAVISKTYHKKDIYFQKEKDSHDVIPKIIRDGEKLVSWIRNHNSKKEIIISEEFELLCNSIDIYFSEIDTQNILKLDENEIAQGHMWLDDRFGKVDNAREDKERKRNLDRYIVDIAFQCALEKNEIILKKLVKKQRSDGSHDDILKAIIDVTREQQDLKDKLTQFKK